MMLPSIAGGTTTEQVGYFQFEAAKLADWIVSEFESTWRSRPAGLKSMKEALTFLAPRAEITRYVCVPIDHWTAVLNNGPLGTDVGVLPSYAARELGCRALRVVNVDDNATYPARVLEVFGPHGRPPLALERAIVAANDGGRWVFETSGTPYPFEDQSAYAKKSKSSRFTSTMVAAYLLGLGVPIEKEPDWPGAVAVEREGAPTAPQS